MTEKRTSSRVIWQVLRCQNSACQRLVLAEIEGRVVQKIFPFVAYELDAKASVPTAIVDDFREVRTMP